MTSCRLCGGAAHPSSGATYGSHWLVCRRCELAFWQWVRAHTNKRGSRKSRRFPGRPACCFYSAAGKWSWLTGDGSEARKLIAQSDECKLEASPSVRGGRAGGGHQIDRTIRKGG